MKIKHPKRLSALMLALFMCLSLSPAAMGERWPGGKAREGMGPMPFFEGSEAPSEEEAMEKLVTGFALPEDEEELFSKRDHSTDYSAAIAIDLNSAAASGQGYTLSDGILRISAAGSYLLSGTLEGQILINCSEEEKVQLALDGVHVENKNGAAVHIAGADKVFITSTEGSENIFSASGDYSAESDTDVDAAIFARCDISFNGKGSIKVLGGAGHGIVTRDDMKICSGALSVESDKRALTGKDSVRIAGGQIKLVCDGDAIRSEHEDEDKGFVYIKGGLLDIDCGADAVQCSGGCFIRGGEINIVTGGGSDKAPQSSVDVQEQESRKGIKSERHIDISSGEISIDAAGDALHSRGSAIISGGNMTLLSGDDGVHADGSLLISGGEVNIRKCFEGLEAELIAIKGGRIYVCSSDDGINAAGGTDGSGFGGWMGGDAFLADMSCAISISGGEVGIDALGDGIDSNGALYISGGTVLIHGPVSGMDGIIDCGSEAIINGGSFVAVSSVGMNMNFSENSAQGSFLSGFSERREAGTELGVYSAAAELLISFQPVREYQSVLVSLPGMKLGESYVLSAGDESVDVLIDESAYAVSPFGGFPGGFGGRRGKADGDMMPPEGMSPPDGSMMPPGVMNPPEKPM